LGDWKERPMAR
jgi:hypothetical protein